MPNLSCVVAVKIPESTTANRFVEGLIKKFQLVGAARTVSTTLESSVYRSVNKQAQCSYFQVITNSDFPASCFVLNEKGQFLTSDLAFREFPGLLKGVFEHEKKLQVEGRGVKLRIGDFTVNFISLFVGRSATVKGVLMEVSILPPCSPPVFRTVLRSFFRQYFPELLSENGGLHAIDVLFTKSFQNFVEAASFSVFQPPVSPVKLLTGQSLNSLTALAPTRLTIVQYVEHLDALRSIV